MSTPVLRALPTSTPSRPRTADDFRVKRSSFVTGGVSRRLSVPGCDLASTHSDAWNLTSVPSSMLVIGAGATGTQIASIFNAFGSRIQLFETGPRILPSEDEDVSAVVAAAFRESGIAVHENFGVVESFEKTPTGVRMIFSKNGNRASAEATLAVLAVGWIADTAGLRLATAGVETDHRGFVQVDGYLRTSTPHIFAAGDITGHQMLVPQAIQEGFVAATNAVRGPTMTIGDPASPIGSFTDPEYAQVGLTEAKARETHDVLTAVLRFDSTTRTIIDGRTVGFCKLLVDRTTCRILGCHVVGERAVEITQLAAIAIAARMRVNDLAHIPLSFLPTQEYWLRWRPARHANSIWKWVGTHIKLGAPGINSRLWHLSDIQVGRAQRPAPSPFRTSARRPLMSPNDP